jgi:hypothetical protein
MLLSFVDVDPRFGGDDGKYDEDDTVKLTSGFFFVVSSV